MQLLFSCVIHRDHTAGKGPLFDPTGVINRYLWGMATHILIGSDHAGIDLKHLLKDHLRARGFEVTDKGTHIKDSVDYPDFAHPVADGVARDPQVLGILICGSGNGVNITANKHTGVRSALAWKPEIAALARQHNNANILALPARFITTEEALRIVDAYMDATFEGGRHLLRVNKIEASA